MESYKIDLRSAVAATLAHTLVMYGARFVGLANVDIGRYVGEVTLPGAAKKEQYKFGLTMHFMLGAFLFPSTYNLVARFSLPKQQPLGSLCWALVLWFTGRNVIIPALGKGFVFEKKPRTGITYLMAHVFYGFVCGSRKGRS